MIGFNPEIRKPRARHDSARRRPRRIGRILIDGRRLTASRTGVGRYLECLLATGPSGLPCPRRLSSSATVGPRPCAEGPGPAGRRSWPKAAGPPLGATRPRPIAPARATSCLRRPTSSRRTGGAVGPGHLRRSPRRSARRFPGTPRFRFGGPVPHRRRARADRILVPSRSHRRADLSRIYGVAHANGCRSSIPAPAPSFRPAPSRTPEVVEARQPARTGDDPFFLFVGKQSRRTERARRSSRHSSKLRIDASRTYRLVFVGTHRRGEPVGPRPRRDRRGACPRSDPPWSHGRRRSRCFTRRNMEGSACRCRGDGLGMPGQSRCDGTAPDRGRGERRDLIWGGDPRCA